MSIFKYCHPQRIDVLQHQFIRFSSAQVLNDPFELKPHLSSLASPETIANEIGKTFPASLAKELAKLPPDIRVRIPKNLLNEFATSALQEAKKSAAATANSLMPILRTLFTGKFDELIGILCLTESPTSILMWAHYADSHRGFVIEFDETCAFFNQQKEKADELRHLRKVIYESARPSISIADIKDFTPFMTKSLEWAYEREWRILQPLVNASKIIGSGPEAIHLFNFPAEAIKSVIFGSLMNEETKEKIADILSSNSHYRHVTISEAYIDEVLYQINLRAIG